MDKNEKRIMDMLQAKLNPIEQRLKANGGKPTAEMQECMDLFCKNQKEVEELIEKKTARGDDMYFGTMGFMMDEEIFAKMQEVQTGFSPDMWNTSTEYRKLQEKLSSNQEQQLSFNELTMLLFMQTFGCYGQAKNLDTAIDMAHDLLTNGILQYKPKENNTRKGNEYMSWLSAFGALNVILGTMYAYKQETIKACYHFLQGLKTEMLQINTPYTDFIRYVLSKLSNLKKGEYEHEGIGYSADNPIGSVDRNKRILVAQAAMQIIPDLVSDNGDILVCHVGTSSPYGHLERLGSTHGNIDIYETWLIDKNFNLKRIIFYWDGYFELFGRGAVLLPVGFRIKKQSRHLDNYKFVKNKNIDEDLAAETAPY